PATAFVALLLALAVAVLIDVALAGNPRAVVLTRAGDTSARLGESVGITLLVHNGGRRRLRGRVRDAWAPSARADPRSHPVDIAAGQQIGVSTLLRPVRRGEQVSAVV